MNNISAGANFTPNSYISNAAQTGGLGAQLKGLQRTADDDAETHQHQEQAQLSRLAQQSIEQSKAQQEGKAAENARQSGADTGIMDDLAHDGSEQNEVSERNRQHELGKSKDGHAVLPGQADIQRHGGDGVVHEEEIELGEIGRKPEDVLADVPAHSAAFAKGNVEAQLTNPAQVSKLQEMKPLPDQQRIEADTPELQPVGTMGPVLGDQETGEVSHPSPQTEGRAPTTVPQEFDAEQLAHMERVVAEQQLAREQSGQGEMLIAGGDQGYMQQAQSGAQAPSGADAANARKSELNTEFLKSRNELVASTGDLEQYGWGGACSELLHKHRGNEQAAAFELKGMMANVFNTDPGLAQIYKESNQNPSDFVARSRQYVAEQAHKHDPADVDATQKMITTWEKCGNFLDAGQACVRETGRIPSQAEMDQLGGKLFDSVSSAPESFQREFKGEMGKLAQEGKLNDSNMSQAAGATSANVAARQLNSMDTRSLFSPPDQTEEEAAAVAKKAQEKKLQWLEDGVDGGLTDAMAFEQQRWAAEKAKTQPSPQLAAYQGQLNDYVSLNTVMRQGYAVSSNNPDYFENSAYGPRGGGKP